MAGIAVFDFDGTVIRGDSVVTLLFFARKRGALTLGGLLRAALAGAVFVGVGVGLVVKAGGAAGGDDALALVISHKTKWNVGKCYLLTDVTVLLLSLSYIPVVNIACSVVTVTLSSAIIGVIHEGKLRHPLRGLTGRRKP